MATRWVRSVAVGVLVCLAGCGEKPSESESKPKGGSAPDSILRQGPYVGILPCADCSGIRTELVLFETHPAAEPVIYHLRQTYLGMPEGDRTLTSAGRWTKRQGPPPRPGATVIQIEFDKPEEARSFLEVGPDSLRLLDHSLAEIESQVPHTLGLEKAARAAAPVLVRVPHDRPIALRVGQELLLRFQANRSTGYTWTLADSLSDIVNPKGTLYVQDIPKGPALGIGGSEYWRLEAARAGEQTLSFEYKRPWEKRPPAQTAVVRVVVRSQARPTTGDPAPTR